MRHLLFSDRQTLLNQNTLPELSESFPTSKVFQRTAFITGATGFIGGYLLKSLIENNSFERYVCLLRCNSQSEGLARLKKELLQKGLREGLFDENQFLIVCGDILKPLLGLKNDDYQFVCQESDHIFHFAATMNWVSPFNQNTIDNLEALRQIVRLCAIHQLKKLHYASSMGLWTLLHHEQQVLLEDVLHDHGDQLAGGYFQSKWVAEQILNNAREKGIPINIYRIGDVKGSSIDGQGDADNFGNLVMHYFIKTGNVIDKPIPEFNFLPVNYVGESIAHISMQRSNGNFQFTNKELISFKDISDVMIQEGFEANHLSLQNWIEKLKVDKSPLGRSLNAIFRSFTPGDTWKPTSFYEIGVDMFTKKHDTQNTNEALQNTNIEAPEMLSNGTLSKYIRHLSTLQA